MNNKMSYSEAGYLGAIRTKEVWRERYSANPNNCEYCGKQLLYEKRKNKFCNHSCAASKNNLGVRRNIVTGNHVIKSCIQCLAKTKNSRFCSQGCHRKHEWIARKNNIKKNGFEKSCMIAKRYLIETNGRQCEICKLKEWCGKPVPLVLDHIDGNSENNQISNLRVVCGNCDMQLPTYKSKNMGNGRHKRRLRYQEGKSY